MIQSMLKLFDTVVRTGSKCLSHGLFIYHNATIDAGVACRLTHVLVRYGLVSATYLGDADARRGRLGLHSRAPAAAITRHPVPPAARRCRRALFHVQGSTLFSCVVSEDIGGADDIDDTENADEGDAGARSSSSRS